jgi:CBS-domain-containing membrane protein
MKIADVMTDSIVSIAPNTHLGDARRLADRNGVRHLPVFEARRLVGIVCVCDLEDRWSETEVVEVMQSPVVTIGTEAPIEQAAHVMRFYGVGCLPVVDRDRVLGIVSRGDLSRAGLSNETLYGDRFCASCGRHHEVLPHERMDFVYFCRDCLERSGPADPTEDLGEAD